MNNNNWNFSQTRQPYNQPNNNPQFQNYSCHNSIANAQSVPQINTEFNSPRFFQPPSHAVNMPRQPNNFQTNNSPQRFQQHNADYNSPPRFNGPPNQFGDIRQPNNFQTQGSAYNNAPPRFPPPQANFARQEIRFNHCSAPSVRPPVANAIGPVMPNTSTRPGFTPLQANLNSIPVTVQSGFTPQHGNRPQPTNNGIPSSNSNSVPFNVNSPAQRMVQPNVQFQTPPQNHIGSNVRMPVNAAPQMVRPPNFTNIQRQPMNNVQTPPQNFTSQFSRGPAPNVMSNNNWVAPPTVNAPSPIHNPPPMFVSQLGGGPAFLPVPPGNEIPPQHRFIPEKERNLLQFLEGFSDKKKDQKSQNSLIFKEYRNAVRKGISLIKELQFCKENLEQMLKSDEQEWESEVKKVLQLKGQLQAICNFLMNTKNINHVKKKLELIKKKRMLKKKIRERKSKRKAEKLKRREELHREIDKWLDSVKEKNLKLKREAEMKKEADNILSEVRRKIHEAKKAIEKLKVFEKLRNARQANFMKKGQCLPEHDQRFQESISHLKETMQGQLVQYDAEERALRVMLEAEQEGQLEEEARWRTRKLKTLQEKKQRNILQSLFGETVEEPDREDPIYLFYQFHNSANKSIENLVQIRRQWDMYIDESGESVPHQWIVPVLPSHPSWEAYLEK